MEFSHVIEQFRSRTSVPGADPALQHVLKFLPPSSTTPSLDISVRGMCIDMAELPKTIDSSKAIADCDIFKGIVERSTSKLERIMQLLKESAHEPSEKRIQEAAAICAEIGLTEKAFNAKGGGFFWIIVIACMAGCMAHCPPPPPQHPH